MRDLMRDEDDGSFTPPARVPSPPYPASSIKPSPLKPPHETIIKLLRVQDESTLSKEVTLDLEGRIINVFPEHFQNRTIGECIDALNDAGIISPPMYKDLSFLVKDVRNTMTHQKSVRSFAQFKTDKKAYLEIYERVMYTLETEHENRRLRAEITRLRTENTRLRGGGLASTQQGPNRASTHPIQGGQFLSSSNRRPTSRQAPSPNGSGLNRFPSPYQSNGSIANSNGQTRQRGGHSRHPSHDSFSSGSRHSGRDSRRPSRDSFSPTSLASLRENSPSNGDYYSRRSGIPPHGHYGPQGDDDDDLSFQYSPHRDRNHGSNSRYSDEPPSCEYNEHRRYTRHSTSPHNQQHDPGHEYSHYEERGGEENHAAKRRRR